MNKSCAGLSWIRTWHWINPLMTISSEHLTRQKSVLVSDQENCNVLMLSSANLKLFHMCGHMGLRGGIRGRGGANGLWETRQLILDMGPECREARTLALQATTSRKGFLHMRALQPTCFTLYNAVHFFLLCRLKINHVKEFMLGSVSMAVNRNECTSKIFADHCWYTMSNPVHGSPVTAGTSLNKSNATLSCACKSTMTEPFLYWPTLCRSVRRLNLFWADESCH